MKPEILFEDQLSPDFKAKLNELFPLKAVRLGRIVFGGDIIICFVQFEGDDGLAENWKQFNSFVTAEYITTLSDEFSRWNFYILYVSNSIVTRQVKYEIENDKFSTRKIVIEGLEGELTDACKDEMIKEHITNANILIAHVTEQKAQLTKDPLIQAAIQKFPQQNKKNTDSLQNILHEIENTLQQ